MQYNVLNDKIFYEEGKEKMKISLPSDQSSKDSILKPNINGSNMPKLHTRINLEKDSDDQLITQRPSKYATFIQEQKKSQKNLFEQAEKEPEKAEQNVADFLFQIYDRVAKEVESGNDEPTQISHRQKQQPRLKEEKPQPEGVLGQPSVAPPIEQKITEDKKKEPTQVTQRSIMMPKNFKTHGEGQLEDTSEVDPADPPSIPYQKGDPNLEKTFAPESVKMSSARV